MTLYATVTSERGKTLGKGGQEYLEIKILNSRKMLYAALFIQGDGEIQLTNAKGVTLLRMNAVEFDEAKQR